MKIDEAIQFLKPLLEKDLFTIDPEGDSRTAGTPGFKMPWKTWEACKTVILAHINSTAEGERDDLRQALCIARENARTKYGMTLRKFAELCGQNPSFISKWTAKDCGQPELID